MSERDEEPGVTVESIEPIDEVPEGMHVIGGLGWTCIRCGAENQDLYKPCGVDE